MADPPAEGGDDDLKTNGDAVMVDGPPETPIQVHPVDTGREEETTRGAFMVVGTMEEARELMKQLKMPDTCGMDDAREVGTAHMVRRCAKQPVPDAGHYCGGGRQVGPSTHDTRHEVAF